MNAFSNGISLRKRCLNSANDQEEQNLLFAVEWTKIDHPFFQALNNFRLLTIEFRFQSQEMFFQTVD